MEKSIRYESIQEPLDDEERELMDPESWDWESVEVLPGGAHVSFEVAALLSGDQYQSLAALAAREGVTPPELIRRIVLDRLAKERNPRPAFGFAESA